MSEKGNELIIDPQLLADISAPVPATSGRSRGCSKGAPAPILSEAERFAAAVLEMPANLFQLALHTSKTSAHKIYVFPICDRHK